MQTKTVENLTVYDTCTFSLVLSPSLRFTRDFRFDRSDARKIPGTRLGKANVPRGISAQKSFLIYRDGDPSGGNPDNGSVLYFKLFHFRGVLPHIIRK